MLTTLLDRDHPLTERGIRQAENLRKAWKEEAELMKEAQTTVLDGIAEEPPSHVPSGSILEDSSSFEADLLGLDNPDFLDGGTTKSTIDSVTPTGLSPALSPPVTSLASSPSVSTNVLHAFSDKERGEGRVLSGHHKSVNISSANIVHVMSSEDESGADGEDENAEGEEDEDTEPTENEQFGARFNRAATVNEIKTRRAEYKRLFLEADHVYCSPLTRAIETAFMALEGHKAMEAHGLILLRYLFMSFLILLIIFCWHD
jgi:hypothetical protein